MSKKLSSKDALVKVIAAALLIAVGILFIVKRDAVLGITFTLLGAALIAYGLFRILRDNDIISGAVLIALGILIIVFGWALAQAACVVAGVALIAYSVYALVKKQIKGTLGWVKFALNLVVGLFLVLGVINASWIFIVIGITMIIYGVFFLFG